MGIYSSGMSCWERHQAGLKQDHAGAGIIAEDKKIESEKVEDKKVVQSDIVFGIADEEGYLAFDGKTWKTRKGVEAAFEKVDEGVGYYIIELPA